MVDERLILRGADGYDEARFARMFNGRRPDRHPAAVLLAESEDTVVEGFKETSLDESTGVVSVTPSVSSEELNDYLSRYGRFFSFGDCPSIGLGGFLLQGGVGMGFRGWGYAAERIAAIDVVTADGELVTADEQNNSDLFWAARGAGPGFCGAITRFHLETRVVPEGLLATSQIYPVERYDEVLEWLWEIHPSVLSPDVALAVVSVIPPFPVPGGDDGFKLLLGGVALSASRDEALEALAPLAESPVLGDALVAQHAEPTTFAERLKLGGAIHPQGKRYLVDSAWLDGPPRDVIAAAKQVVAERPSGTRGHAFFDFSLPRRDAPDMAASLPTDVMLGSYVIYDDEQNDDAYRAWHLAAMKALEPFTVGQYWGDSDQTQREVKTLTDDAWARLQRIRAERDPNGLFADYLAGPGGFRNVNGWETNQ